LPVQKGFPAVGTEDIDLKDSLNNPFLDVFYEFSPIFTIYSGDKLIGYYGEMPQRYKKHHLGYFAANPIFDQNENYMIVGNQYSGEIQMFEFSDNSSDYAVVPFKRFFLGAFGDEIWPTIDPEKFAKKLEYFKAYERTFFRNKPRILMDFDVSGNWLIALIKEDGEYKLWYYDLESESMIKTIQTGLRSDEKDLLLHTVRLHSDASGKLYFAAMYANGGLVRLCYDEVEL